MIMSCRLRSIQFGEEALGMTQAAAYRIYDFQGRHADLGPTGCVLALHRHSPSDSDTIDCFHIGRSLRMLTTCPADQSQTTDIR
jgi:hypothetical protein